MKKLSRAIAMVLLWLFSTAMAQTPFPVTKHDYESGNWCNYVDTGWSGLPTRQVSAICFAGKDSVWIGGDWGLSLWRTPKNPIQDPKTDLTQNWQHWKFSDSSVQMDGERVDRIYLWGKDRLLILTAELVGHYWTTKDGVWISDYNWLYRFYLAKPFSQEWTFLYSFENAHYPYPDNEKRSIVITELAIDRKNELVWFAQGDFLGRMNVATGQVDSLYFTGKDKYDSDGEMYKISGVTIDNNGYVWLIGKVGKMSLFTVADNILKIDNSANILHSIIKTWGITKVMYNSYDKKFYVVGKSINEIDPETGKLITHEAPNTREPFQQVSIDQFGSFWVSYSEHTQGLASSAFWYNPTSGEEAYSHFGFGKMDVYWAVPRPGTKQVWFAGYLLGIPIYTYPSWVSVEEEGQTAPEKFSLSQNYPNPFNSETTIAFSLIKHQSVKLTVFNSLGKQVAELLNSPLSAGRHTVQFNGKNLPSGIYFYRLSTSQEVRTGKMLLVR